MASRIYMLGIASRACLAGGLALASAASASGFGQGPAAHPVETPRKGVETPGVSRSMSAIVKQAEFKIAGSPDWSVVTKDSVWVTTGRADHVVQMVEATNKVGFIVDVARPCSGLADGFGSIWSPSCKDHAVMRIDPATGKVIAKIAADPANSEGGITVGDGAVWIVTKPSTLVRIDPATNAVVKTIPLPSESENPMFSDGFIWVSSYGHDELLKVDPDAGKIVATIPVGPKPRFLTAGAGSIWTLNQGDGTGSRVDAKTGKVLATIPCGIQGGGGEITFGDGFVWATMFDFPLTKIDPATSKVAAQWGGPGGDGIRFGFHSVWLSNGAMGSVWRLSPDQK